MQDAILVYFQGEKHAALMVASIGLLSLAAAVLFCQPRWELRSFAIVLAVFGALELTIGAGLYLRTGPQIANLLTQLGADAPRFLADELPRMLKVQRNFELLQYIWLAVLTVAAVVALTQKSRPTLWAVMLGLVIHAAFFFAFDQVAERRGAVYLRALQSS